VFAEYPRVEALVEALQAGDSAAERAVYERFLPRVKMVLRRRVRDDGAVAELANDVLFSVIDAMRAGRLRTLESLPAYAYSVARNLAASYLRRHLARRIEERMPAAFDCPAPDPPDHAEQIASARRLLERLEEPDRTILLLVLVEGLKPGEIGRRVGLSSDAVKARKSRAIRRLVNELAVSIDRRAGGEA
jgi:RNA polymerase sigma factor (sigma-70 family)